MIGMSKRTQKDNKKVDKSLSTELPVDMEQAIEKLPEETQKIVRESIVMSMHGNIRPIDPFTEHIDKEVLCKIIENSDEASKRDDMDKKDARRYSLIIIISILIFLVIILIAFKNNLDGISRIITPLLTALLGFGGGYGYGYKKGQEN
jgi:hypothetical protein